MVEMNYKMSKYNYLYKGAKKNLLYNTYSTGLLELDSDNLVKKIEECMAQGYVLKYFSEEHNDILKQNGFIVDQELNEVDLIKFRYRKGAYDTSELFIQIIPTTRCNFSCPYCFQTNKADESMNENDCVEVENFIERQIKENSPRSFQISWYGGEPLLEVDTIERLALFINDTCEKNGISKIESHMVTNGYFLDEKTALRLTNCGIKDIQITLDGGRSDHNRLRFLADGSGTFDEVINGVYVASKYFRDTVVRFNINRLNLDSIRELIASEEVFKSENVIVFPGYLKTYLGGTMNKGQDVHMFTGDEFRKIQIELIKNNKRKDVRGNILTFPAKMNNCYADAFSAYNIGPGGKVYKCLERIAPEEVVGYIKDGELRPNKIYWDWLIKEPFINNTCENCLYLPMCMGGCPSARRIVGVPNDEVCSYWSEYLKTKLSALDNG
jgi:uncharacterized protein